MKLFLSLLRMILLTLFLSSATKIATAFMLHTRRPIMATSSIIKYIQQEKQQKNMKRIFLHSRNNKKYDEYKMIRLYNTGKIDNHNDHNNDDDYDQNYSHYYNFKSKDNDNSTKNIIDLPSSSPSTAFIRTGDDNEVIEKETSLKDAIEKEREEFLFFMENFRLGGRDGTNPLTNEQEERLHQHIGILKKFTKSERENLLKLKKSVEIQIARKEENERLQKQQESKTTKIDESDKKD